MAAAGIDMQDKFYTRVDPVFIDKAAELWYACPDHDVAPCMRRHGEASSNSATRQTISEYFFFSGCNVCISWVYIENCLAKSTVTANLEFIDANTSLLYNCNCTPGVVNFKSMHSSCAARQVYNLPTLVWPAAGLFLTLKLTSP